MRSLIDEFDFDAHVMTRASSATERTNGLDDTTLTTDDTADIFGIHMNLDKGGTIFSLGRADLDLVWKFNERNNEFGDEPRDVSIRIGHV